MNLLALDVASTGKTGYAYRKSDGTWVYGSVRFSPTCQGELRGIVATAHVVYGVDTAVIEDGYVGVNARTSLTLAEARGAAISECDRRNMKVAKAMPSAWQTAMLSQGGRIPKGETKHLSMLVASEIVGVTVTDEHAADAICLYTYYHKLHQLEGGDTTMPKPKKQEANTAPPKKRGRPKKNG